jgi:hypothetical protein
VFFSNSLVSGSVESCRSGCIRGLLCFPASFAVRFSKLFVSWLVESCRSGWVKNFLLFPKLFLSRPVDPCRRKVDQLAANIATKFLFPATWNIPGVGQIWGLLYCPALLSYPGMWILAGLGWDQQAAVLFRKPCPFVACCVCPASYFCSLPCGTLQEWVGSTGLLKLSARHSPLWPAVSSPQASFVACRVEPCKTGVDQRAVETFRQVIPLCGLPCLPRKLVL